MKTRTVYICEFCHSEYKTSKEAYECEAKCLGLTVEQYKEYVNLLQEEKRAFGVASCYMNDEVRKRCDDVVKAVLDFQKEHNFTDNR